jgi:Undecaprenyl-phosphate glucose phosphotransferase
VVGEHLAGVSPPAGLWAMMREAMVPVAVPLVLLAFWGFGLYRPRRDGSLIAEQWQVVKASLVTVVAMIVAMWALGPQDAPSLGDGSTVTLAGHALDASRVQMGVLAALLTLMAGAERMAFRSLLRSLRRRGWNLRHVCIIGTGRLGHVVCRTLDRNSWTGIHVAYFVSHNEEMSARRECCGRPILGGLSDLDRIMETDRPDAVYIALPTARTLVRPALLRRLERYAVDVRVVPDIQPRYLPDRMVMGELDGMPVLSVRESPMHGFGGAVKRLIDAVGAFVAIVVFSPLMLAIAGLVRLSGPGPIIFKQRRVSLGGEEFQILKFRTMFHAADESGPAGWTARNDPRITPIGRWLRRTSLDELPQLFNVLAGDMSLVGPRPERPELISRFRDDWRGYMLRQHVKAGITGWAQVNGLRGDTSLRKRLQLDLFYIRNWSLGFDLKILWLTLFRGFVNRNAH